MEETTNNQVVVAPVYLKNMEAICKMFGRGEKTIKQWREDGAPIEFDGRGYSADYHALQNWRAKMFGQTAFPEDARS